tara:strand:- start:16996 stop:17997 length:1002 start_codon:yes stop_codon:yes gene_type:complete
MDLISFPRQMGLRRAICNTPNDLQNYLNRLNNLSSVYISLYSFDEINNGRVDYDTAVMDRAWWDFDATEEHTMDEVKQDVATLINRLDGDVRLVATGRGFHIHQLFQKPVRGRDWAYRLDTYEKAMAKGLSSLDGVGYPEKLTRVPNTYNPKRKKRCVVLPARLFASDPLGFKIPKQNEHPQLCPFFGELNGEVLFDLISWWNENGRKEETKERTLTKMPINAVTASSTVPLPPCLQRAISVSNPPHHVRVALAQFMSAGLRWYSHPQDLSSEELHRIEDEICSFIGKLGWSDYNPQTTRKAVKSLMMYERYPSPIWFKKNNLCDGVGCWYCR